MINSFPEDKISAVHALEGRRLKSGWEVMKPTKSKPGSTGGHFSVCYLAKKGDKEGFLKALNILAFLRDDSGDMLQATTEMLNTFQFEKDVMERCEDKSLSKVSRLLYAGQENVPGFLVANVYYMIFELADGDVRNHLNFTGLIDDAWKLRSLHNIAVGIRQLHSIDISHQDIKPSNAFVFEGIVTKVGDLGRALCQELNSPHAKLDFSGDMKYAPPEVFHKFVLPDWRQKTFAIDSYLLGSMAAFYFTGQSMTALLAHNIDRSINILSMNFDNALPYWIMAFDGAIQEIHDHTVGITDQDKLIDLIRMLGHPDPRKRGHPKNILSAGDNYELERIVQLLDLLASKAEYKLKN